MLPLETLSSVTTSDGYDLVLYRRDGAFQIRVNGLELMSSRAHGSEEALARLACQGLEKATTPRVLIGGLGMGYTLRAALDLLPTLAEVVVAEVFTAVVDWNRGPLASLAGRPLDDPRVRLEVRDVLDVLEGHDIFDAVVLDVDNGPAAFTLRSNDRLYSPSGLRRLQRVLKPNGVLAVWSGDDDDSFGRRLSESGFRVRIETVPVHESRGRCIRHTLFMAYRASAIDKAP